MPLSASFKRSSHWFYLMLLTLKLEDRGNKPKSSSAAIPSGIWGELCHPIPRPSKLLLGHLSGVREVLPATERGGLCIQETKI